MDRFI